MRQLVNDIINMSEWSGLIRNVNDLTPRDWGEVADFHWVKIRQKTYILLRKEVSCNATVLEDGFEKWRIPADFDPAAVFYKPTGLILVEDSPFSARPRPTPFLRDIEILMTKKSYEAYKLSSTRKGSRYASFVEGDAGHFKEYPNDFCDLCRKSVRYLNQHRASLGHRAQVDSQRVPGGLRQHCSEKEGG